MPELIADTSPIQYLYQLNLLDLLQEIYGGVTIPRAVVREMDRGRARGISLPDIASLSWVSVKDVREQFLLPLAPDLGPGEREMLALAAQAPDSLALLDDAVARQHARLLGIAFTGTCGVLLKAKQSGRLTALAPLLDRLDSLRFRLDTSTREFILKIAGE